MKTYLVNLDHKVDRMEYMSGLLSNAGIEYERVSAVYGKDLSIEDRRKCFRPFHSFVACARRLTDGEIGCSLSHLKIYQKMVDENIQIALVLEDDIVIVDEFKEQINVCEKRMDATKPQVVVLSNFSLTCPSDGFVGLERIHYAMCTDGYIITLPAARIILECNLPVVVQADSWPRWEKRYGVELYAYWPKLLTQDNLRFGTDISTNIKSVGPGVSRVVYKATRVFEKIIDELIFMIFGK